MHHLSPIQHTRSQLLTKKNSKTRKTLHFYSQPASKTSIPSSPCLLVPLAASVSKLLRPGACWGAGIAPCLRGAGLRLLFASGLTLAAVNGSMGWRVGGRELKNIFMDLHALALLSCSLVPALLVAGTFESSEPNGLSGNMVTSSSRSCTRCCKTKYRCHECISFHIYGDTILQNIVNF